MGQMDILLLMANKLKPKEEITAKEISKRLNISDANATLRKLRAHQEINFRRTKRGYVYWKDEK